MNNEQNKVRCAIYTRKSTDEGLDMDFNSLDAQREACENYIRSQVAKGWQILPERYDDGGFSGGNNNRPGLQKLLEDCRQGKVDIIVIYKIDRLSRSLYDFAELSKLFDEYKVDFCSVTQEINTSTSAGRMMLNILMTFSEFERSIVTERIRDKMAATRRKGEWVGGTVPCGYKVENKKLVLVPERAEVVKRVFKRFIEIQSPKQITYELNQEGILTNQGKEWSVHHIYRMLNNYTYIGKIYYKGEVFDGKQERIISDKLWERVQEILRSDAPVKDYKGKMETLMPLKGLLYCGHCGCRMGPTYAKKGGTMYSYYLCTKDSKRAESLCPVSRVSGGEIESAVLLHIKKMLCTPTIVNQLARDLNTPGREVAEVLNKLTPLWDEMFPAERNRLMHLLLKKVTLYEDHLDLDIRTAGVEQILEELDYENLD